MNKTVAALMLISPFVVGPAFASVGPDIYKTKCAVCHGVGGAGDTAAGKALKAKSLMETDVIKASNVDLVSIVKNGKNKMPAYTGKLTDDEIKETIAYVRVLQKK